MKEYLNLKPIKKGQRLAAKPDHKRQTANIVLRVTPTEKARLVHEAHKLGKTLKDYILEGK